MDGLVSTLGALFVAGLTVGVGPCMVHCAPALAFYVTGTADGWRAGLKAALGFALARLSAHTLLGALAGGIGASLVTPLLLLGPAAGLLPKVLKTPPPAPDPQARLWDPFAASRVRVGVGGRSEAVMGSFTVAARRISP